jgi:hypothetical protein
MNPSFELRAVREANFEPFLSLSLRLFPRRNKRVYASRRRMMIFSSVCIKLLFRLAGLNENR